MGSEDDTMLQAVHSAQIHSPNPTATEDTDPEQISVPESVVKDKMKDFEKNYNLGDMTAVSSIYAANTWVSVTPLGLPHHLFYKPAEVAEFLGKLRNEWGCKNIDFDLTSVEGSIHTDTWTCDIGTGSCEATWEYIGEEWVIVADEITFVAYTEKQLAVKKVEEACKKSAKRACKKACKKSRKKGSKKDCKKDCKRACNTALKACKKANKHDGSVCTIAAGRFRLVVADNFGRSGDSQMAY